MKKQQNRGSSHSKEGLAQGKQPSSVQNDAPGYGNKKLEGPNRPST